MKRFIPILMMLLLLTGCGAQSSETTYRQISMEEAVTMMEEETEYISKEEVMDGIREGLTEMFRAQRMGIKQKTLQELIDEL